MTTSLRARFDELEAQGGFPPRHQEGCRQNMLRAEAMIILLAGGSIEEIVAHTLRSLAEIEHPFPECTPREAQP